MSELHVSDTRRRSGWFWLDNEVFDIGLDPYEFMVYAFLVRIADRSSEVACASTHKIAKALNISRDKLYKALKTLEEKKLIVKKNRKSEKGADLANLYYLTPKNEWTPNPEAKKSGVCHTDTPLSATRTPPCPSDGHPLSATRTPPVCHTDTLPTSDRAENVDRQENDSRVSLPINIYIDQYSKDQKSIDQYTHTLYRCNACEKEREVFVSEERPGGKKEEGSKKPSAFEGSAAVEKFRAKGLKRLTPQQAAFFYLNSGEEDVILEVDRNKNISNPVGYLIKVLGIDLSKAQGKHLLHAREECVSEEEDPPKGVEEFLDKIASELHINVAREPYEVKRKKIAMALYRQALTKEERMKVLKAVKETKKDLRQEIKTAMIWHLFISKMDADRELKRNLERYLV